MKKQKILFVVRQLGSSGGVERRVEQLSKSPLQKKFDIRVFSFLGILETYETPKNKLLSVLDYLKRVFKIIIAIQKEKPDIIHAFDLESVLYVAIGLRFMRSKKIRFIGGYGAEKIFDRRTRLLLKHPFFHPDIFICNSQNGKASLHAVTENKIPVKIIYNGFTPNNFDCLPQPDWYNPKSLYVGLISKFDDFKRAERVFELAEALTKNENIRFVVVGTGRDFEQALARHDNSQFYKERIIFLGVVDNAWKLIPWFDMGLLTSDSEGFPTVLIEFLSMKKPVLSTHCGESAFILNNGKAGILEEHFNAEIFAEHICKVCKRGEINKIGYEWYIQNFSFEHMLSQYEKVYTQLN